MAHPRQDIREAVKAALVAANTAAGSRVFETRVLPLGTVQLPALSVYSLDETVDPRSKAKAPRELYRTVNVAIDAIVSTPANGAVDDALDALCLEVEAAMHADPTLNEKAGDLILTSTTLGTVDGGNRPMAAAQLVYAVEYQTAAPEATEAEDLETVHVTTSLGGTVHEDDQAQDEVTGFQAP